MSTDVLKSDLPNKQNHELAEDLLARFPGVDRAALLKDMVAHYFMEMRWGNKREERAACDFLNQLQRIAASQKTVASLFVIRRPGHPNWYAGANEYGPIWSSSFTDALRVSADMLIKLMRDLAEHKPCASLEEEK